MNGNLFSGKPLYVGLAQRKDIRKAQLEAQHTHRSNGVPGVPIRVPGVPMLPPHPIYPTPGPMYYPGAPMMQGPPQRTHVYPPGMQRQPRVHSNPQAHNGQYPYGMPNYGAQGQRPQTQLPRNPNPRKFATQANGTLVPQPNGNSMIPPSATQQPNGKPRNIGGNPQQRGFKYTPTARNAVQMAPPQSVAAPVQAPVTTLPSLEQLELTMGPEEAKQVIGEQIYFSISRIHPQYAALSGKITGMLLELELRDLYGLLQNRSLLESKVNEAIQVLEANSKDGASSPLISEGQSVS
eukprot:TRINITY_DN895_c0_g3_i2.p1 TRINITY_DN895_c0_g3~~TRINITY_DN895_c0_g3_i2.p1  ORF type:complete len:294 (-),score=61.11 TRINITY_DN895_c0_g3_i2:105-986(-)